MIGTVLLIGGLLAAGGALLAAFWDELVDFIKRAVMALKALIYIWQLLLLPKLVLLLESFSFITFSFPNKSKTISLQSFSVA